MNPEKKTKYNNKLKIRLLDQVLEVLYVRSIKSLTLSSDVSYPAVSIIKKKKVF